MTPKDLATYADGVYRASAGLIRMAPEDRWNWKPQGNNYMTLGQVCCHLATSTGAIIRSFVTGDWGKMPEESEMLPTAEKMPTCSKQEALDRLEQDRLAMHRTLDALPLSDFDHKVVSAPWGGEGPLWSYCLSMVEHQSNHKMHLFQYLKQLGLPVGTQHLYGM